MTEETGLIATGIEAIDNGLQTVLGDFYRLPADFDLIQSKYDFTARRFPLDLGEQSFNGHYMVININVQDGTRFDNQITDESNRKIRTFQKLSGPAQPAGGRYIGSGPSGELSKVDSLRYNIDKKWKDDSNVNFSTALSSVIPRQTRRIVESIALYMPNTVVFDTSNDYEDVGLTRIGMDAVSGAVGLAENIIPKQFKGLLSKATRAAQNTAEAGAKLIQRPINPRVEVLFRNTLQRTFQFDFLFAPASPDESEAMEQIIKTLRFHAAPEYSNLFGSFVYIPPSEFDITFFNRGVENTSIPRISTCALTKISVDYAPQGVYSTFRRTDSPVSCRMQIEFRELEVVSKLRVLQGF